MTARVVERVWSCFGFLFRGLVRVVRECCLGVDGEPRTLTCVFCNLIRSRLLELVETSPCLVKSRRPILAPAFRIVW